MKPCVVRSKRKGRFSNRQTEMNSRELIATEINTEIKVEVQLETASIIKVETKRLCSIINSDNSPNAPIEMSSTKALENEKSRDEIKAEREAKKLAKQAKKIKANGGVTGEQTKTESEAKKMVKQATKTANKSATVASAPELVTQQLSEIKIEETNTNKLNDVVNIGDASGYLEKKKQSLTKGDRRAIQEAQRAAKAQRAAAGKAVTASAKVKPANTVTISNANVTLKTSTNTPSTSHSKEAKSVKRAMSSSPAKTVCFKNGNVKLFSHLEKPNTNANLFVNNIHIHPSISRLGEQYAKRTVVGSNARCIAFLNAIKIVIQDYETPPKKEFNRSLESFISNCVVYLQKCRALAVSVINAHKSLKQVLMQLPKDEPESELKERLFTFIDTYLENQIGKAAQAINSMMQKKINNGDVILTFGCSSLINYICEEAQVRNVDFRVIVVDSRPFCEGQELLRRLTAKEIPCTYVLINAISFVMPEVTKVLLGAHALLANGNVMSRTGTAQVALVARSFNVPVLVCCETHKFSERFQTDAIVYNELGNPDDIVVDDKCCLSNWQAKYKMTPLNLNYDITPPELVTAVVTEVSVLPCTSVPVILRMKPDWLV